MKKIKNETVVHIKVDVILYSKIKKLCKSKDITATEAVRFFFKQAILKNKIIFEDMDTDNVNMLYKIKDDSYISFIFLQDFIRAIKYVNNNYESTEIIKVKEIKDIHKIAYIVNKEIHIRNFTKGQPLDNTIISISIDCSSDINKYFKE